MAKHSTKCPRCGQPLEVDMAADERIVCPKCQAGLTLPGKSKPSVKVHDLIGQTLGEFEVLELLGRGGMGSVYKARQVSLDRLVALKVLSRSVSSNAKFLGRFTREARAAAAVSHANIIEVFSVGEDKGYPYIAMEFVDGQNLEDKLKSEGSLPADWILEAMKQCTAALAKAHAAGIIHRDIKPPNILLTADGRVKIADFGIAKRPESDVTLTAVGAALGTPQYISPEVAAGKPADGRSDLYSLGATFYHALAGRPPFEGKTAMELAVKHTKEPVPPLSETAPDAPPELCRLIHNLLQKEPAKRFSSADKLLHALERVEEQMSGSAQAIGIGVGREQVHAKKGPSSRTLTIGGAVAAIAIVILVVLWLSAPQGPWQAALATGDQRAEVLLREEHFGEAIEHYKSLIERYDERELRDTAQLRIEDIRSQADKDFARIERESRKLLNERTFDQARAALTPIIESWGLPDKKRRAQALLKKINAAEKEPARPWQKALAAVDKTAADLLREQRFREAIGQYKSLSKRFNEPELRSRTAKRIEEANAAAATAFARIEAEVEKRLAAKEFDDARAALQPFTGAWGIPEMTRAAGRLLGKVDAAEREFTWRGAEGNANELVRQRRFGAAIQEYKQAAERFSKLEQLADTAIGNVSKTAHEEYKKLEGQVKEPLAEELGQMSREKLDLARTLLTPVFDAWEVPALTEKAQALRTEIDEKQQEWEEWRFEAALKSARAMEQAWDFKAAADALAEVMQKETELLQRKTLADRLARRIEEVQRLAPLKTRMIQQIKKAGLSLKKADLRLSGLNGDVTGADDTAIATRLPDGKTESHPWNKLSARSVQALLQLVIDPKNGRDCLAAGVLAQVNDAHYVAESYFRKAGKLGVDVGPYLDSFVGAALQKVKALIGKQKFSEAERELKQLEKKYAETLWVAAHKKDLEAAQSQIAEGLAEELYALAAKLFKERRWFDLKRPVLKLKKDYANTPTVKDGDRRPSVAEMQGVVSRLGKKIVVRQRGSRDFRTIQKAIFSAPPYSEIEIQDNGPYNERIIIPKEKEGLILRGKEGCWPIITAGGDRIAILAEAAELTLERLVITGPLHANWGPVHVRSSILSKSQFNAGPSVDLDTCVSVGDTSSKIPITVSNSVRLTANEASPQTDEL